MRRLLLATSAVIPLGIVAAGANPQGGQVVGGAAAVQGTGTPTVTVTQSSQHAVINWNSFNIGTGETTQFVQPNSAATVLNRVLGDPNPSQIFGTLTANGRVFLINPNGVLIGNGAVINTAGFLATTHDIANQDFMAGRYNFNIPGRPDASIVNLGSITASNAGFAALVAPGVRNSGTITANFGKIGLASANGFSLDLYGDSLIKLDVKDSIAGAVKDVATGQTLKSLVQNDGTLRANGGQVQLTAAAARQVVDSVINTSGVIEARSIGRRNGKIVLGGPTGTTKLAGAPTQTVKVAGKLSVAGKRKGSKGGSIKVTGENIELAGAMLDASGAAGGGTILIGGDVGGGHPSPLVGSIVQASLEPGLLPTATTVSIDTASSLDASAKTAGDGGKVVVWSDGATTFGGQITARGGVISGNGGFVEVSGKQALTFNGKVDPGAANGNSGTLLLDPISGRVDTVAGPGVILVSAIEAALASSNVIVTTNNSTGSEDGDLTVAAPITWASANNLTLSAYRNVIINANVTNTYADLIGGGFAQHKINVRADNTGTGFGTVMFGDGAVIKSMGAINIAFNPSVNPAGSGVNGASYVGAIEDFSGHVDLTGGGVLNHYFLVNTPADLQNVQNNLTANYALGRNIDMSGFAGFVPIGAATANGFEGSFIGLKHTISNLTIRYDSQNVGLFSTLAVSANVGQLNLVDFDVTSLDASGGSAGAIAGTNFGTIHDIGIVGARVTSTALKPAVPLNIGGGVGWNFGTLAYVDTATIEVVVPELQAGTVNAGGLVGLNDFIGEAGLIGTIAKSNVGAAVTSNASGGDISLGLLVGTNNAVVSKALTVGQITDNNNVAAAGGSVGRNDVFGTVDQVLASASVTGGAEGAVGGVIGINANESDGAVGNAYWNVSSWPGDGIGSSSVNTSGTTALTAAQVTSGMLPDGLSAMDWTAIAGIPSFVTPRSGSEKEVLQPKSGLPPTIPDSVIAPPVYVGYLPPPDGSNDLVLLISLGGPPGSPGGQGINLLGGAPQTFILPPLPLRAVPGLGGERFSSVPPPSETRFLPDEVVLLIDASVPPDEIERITRQLGLSLIASEKLGSLGQVAFRFHITDGRSVRDIIRALEQFSIIGIAQPNYVYGLVQPAEPALSKGDPAQYTLNKLQLLAAHKLALGRNVTIAVINSEVDKKHTELTGAISEELDTIGIDEPPHFHGTAMAGAIVSRDRLLGVAPAAKILAVRAFSQQTSSAEGITFHILRGIDWAIKEGARVINMSFAGPRDPLLHRAINAAHDRGVVLVGAAGNAGPKSPPLYPGAEPNVIAVTATDDRDRVFRGANNGPQLSLAAPGVEIIAPAPAESYQMSTGTSIATAHVSGVVALMLERDPTLKPDEVRKILQSTATDLGARGKDAQFGWGLVNPRKALEAVDARLKSSNASRRRR